MLSKLFNGLLTLLALPICCLIALMDTGNGMSYKQNLNLVMGLGQNGKYDE